MTDQTAQEPTMEEILASIRRIISEDDAPAEAAPEAVAEPAPSPAPAEPTPPAAEAVEEDVLELTEEAPAEQTIGDLEVTAAAPEPEPEPEPEPVSESVFTPEPVAEAEPEHPSVPTPVSGGLVGDAAASTAGAAFAGLASSLRKPEADDAPAVGGPTIDEITRQLLRPMLKDWLDANLPAIVEAQVRKEVERIARSAG